MTAIHIQDNHRSAAASARASAMLRRFLLAAILVLGLCIGAFEAVRIHRTALQFHQDSTVGTVWVAGVSYGARPTLQQGNPLMRWMNRHGIQAFGKAETLVSRFNGNEGGLEIWFACHSN